VLFANRVRHLMPCDLANGLFDSFVSPHMGRRAKPVEDVLVYSDGKRRTGHSIRKAYDSWRAAQTPPLADRCDNPDCIFHNSELVWNGKRLPLILDHVNGVNTDNRPKNLRYLCPNCDSQNSETRGGANRGRVEKSPGGFAILGKDGKHAYTMPLSAARMKLFGNPAGIKVKRSKDEG
jgi:hypothetical protein